MDRTNPKTVGELITELQKFPADMSVKVMIFDADYDSKTGEVIATDNFRAMPVHHIHDGFIGDGEQKFLSIEAAGNDINL